MRLLIATVGKTARGPERELSDRYLQRIGQMAAAQGVKCAVKEIAQSRAARPDDRQREEADALRGTLPAGAMKVILDEGGRTLSSKEFADRMSSWQNQAVADVAFVIGGPDGLATDLVDSADLVVAFGRMSWPHQLARVMLLEQIYRALTIIAGHPYHRA